MSEVLGPLKEFEPLELLRRDIQTLSETALTQRIGSKETKDAALAVGADVKRVRKLLEDRRTSITGPMQDTVKRIIAYAKQLDEPLARAEAHIRAQAISYAESIAAEQRRAAAALEMDRQRILREEEAKRRSAAALAETPEENLQAQAAIERESKVQRAEVAAQAKQVKSEGVKGTTEVFKFEVSDEALVPREYLQVNSSAIRQAIYYKHLREIPGVKIWVEKSVRLG